MPRNTQYYSQATHSVSIGAVDNSWGPFTLQDFAEGDSIEWTPNVADKVAVMDGFDKSGLSVSSSRSGKITIKLKPTSPWVGFLTSAYQKNKTQPQIMNVAITTGVNEIHTLTNCGVNKEGGKSGAATMSERGFSFVGTELIEDESTGN